jgi:2,4-dienoyl-CoA reductase-like NADH-dependent reductase (Old Yellow Enzyme family)
VRPPALRRFGRTGLTFPEIGIGRPLPDAGTLAEAYRLGVRWFVGAAESPGVSTSAAGSDRPGAEDLPGPAAWVTARLDASALAALGDRPAVAPVTGAARIAGTLVVELAGGLPPGAADRLLRWRERSTIGGLAAAVDAAEDLRLALSLGCFDAVVLDLERPGPGLGDSAAALRDWGGAVVVNLPALMPDLRGLLIRFVLRSPLVSVVTAPCQDPADLRDLLAAADGPAWSADELDEVRRALNGSAIGVALAALRTETQRPARPEPGPRPAPPRDLSDAWLLGRLQVPNRVVRSGTTERAVDAEGLPTEAMLWIHRGLAAGGAGLVISGYLAVSTDSRASASHGVLRPGAPVDAWRRLLDSCRQDAPDALFCAQLGHGGALSLDRWNPGLVAQDFAAATRAAADAGFDAVQLHGAHGYLLGQLLAAAPRLRDRPAQHDGLDVVRLVIDAVLTAAGGELAVLMKLNCSDFAATYDQRDADVAVDRLAGTGIDGVEWSAWVPSAPSWWTPSRIGDVDPHSEGFFVPFASGVKARHPTLAVGTCGGFRTRSGMQAAVDAYGLDFVSLSRPLVVEPGLPHRLVAGSGTSVCDGCNECLAKHVRPLHCPKAPQLLIGDGLL